VSANPRFIDLSMPIHEHFRWPVDTRLRGDPVAGDQYRVARVVLVGNEWLWGEGQWVAAL